MADQDVQTTDLVLDHLLSRAGFDAWWDDIDDDTKYEIVEDLADIIREQRVRG